MTTHYPPGLPDSLRRHWREPWTRAARGSRAFRSWLDRHGYLTPHFKIAEAACHDGTQIPRRLRARARNHAFNMERLRHALGDIAIPVISWYRTEAYNRSVHGAIHSRHVQADAADVSASWVDKTGRDRVQHAAEVIFADGGVGTYPAGSMHFDSRGTRARWTSYIGWR
jgi:hypothetical protein